MGRHKDARPGEPETRAYLLQEAKRFMTSMVSTMLQESTDGGRYAFDALHPRVAALSEGREVTAIHGWELPDGHWARGLGTDRNWTLGADDILRPYDPPPGARRFVPPGNRASRRAMGWRE